MINNSEFAQRLTEIMEYYQLSASAFSDKIQVPRSSISHLISGRNKPSLDFVLKVVKEFNEVELYWLLNGKGSFPSQSTPALTNVSPTEFKSTGSFAEQPATVIPPADPSEGKNLERIVFFYNDGTFKEYRT